MLCSLSTEHLFTIVDDVKIFSWRRIYDYPFCAGRESMTLPIIQWPACACFSVQISGLEKVRRDRLTPSPNHKNTARLCMIHVAHHIPISISISIPFLSLFLHFCCKHLPGLLTQLLSLYGCIIFNPHILPSDVASSRLTPYPSTRWAFKLLLATSIFRRGGFGPVDCCACLIDRSVSFLAPVLFVGLLRHPLFRYLNLLR